MVWNHNNTFVIYVLASCWNLGLYYVLLMSFLWKQLKFATSFTFFSQLLLWVSFV